MHKVKYLKSKSSDNLTTFVYDATGKVTTRKSVSLSNNTSNEETNFFYKSNGQLEKSKSSQFSSQFEYTFEYNTNGKISKRTYSGTYQTYTYDSKGNVLEIGSSTRSNYDDKNNVNLALKDGYPDNPSYSSPNNVGLATFYGVSYKYIYTYNSNGFVTILTREETDLLSNKFIGSRTSNAEYSDCQ